MAKRLHAGVFGLATQFLLYPEEAIVFGYPFGTTGSTSFYLTSVQPNAEIADRRVFGFAGAMTYNSRPPGLSRHIDGGSGLGQGPDLV